MIEAPFRIGLGALAAGAALAAAERAFKWLPALLAALFAAADASATVARAAFLVSVAALARCLAVDDGQSSHDFLAVQTDQQGGADGRYHGFDRTTPAHGSADAAGQLLELPLIHRRQPLPGTSKSPDDCRLEDL
jgi:hypothetical protein